MKSTTIYKIIFVLFFLSILGAGSTIPFVFESPSMFYKTGTERFLLRSGKIIGILTAVLIICQPFFISRFKIFEKAFGLRQAFRIHRICGLLLLVTALAHPILILGADNFALFPLESRYWPEFTGIALLILLTFFVLISFFVKKLGLNYKRWRIFHRSVALVILLLMFVHVFKVSKSFESGLPFSALAIAAAAGAGLVVRKFFK